MSKVAALCWISATVLLTANGIGYPVRGGSPARGPAASAAPAPKIEAPRQDLTEAPLVPPAAPDPAMVASPEPAIAVPPEPSVAAPREPDAAAPASSVPPRRPAQARAQPKAAPGSARTAPAAFARSRAPEERRAELSRADRRALERWCPQVLAAPDSFDRALVVLCSTRGPTG